jgi:alanine racemase
MRQCLIQLRQAALTHNLQQVRLRAPHSRVLSMVKANAYGHGIAGAVAGLADSDAFGVAFWAEALAVRALTDKPVVLIEGAFTLDEWLQAGQQGFHCLIHQPRQLDWALAHPRPDRPVWLKINTGMNRLGFVPEAAIRAGQQLQAAGHTLVLTMHFANADQPDAPSNAEQVARFSQVRAALPEAQVSLCNSAALLHWPALHGDWVRPGIMLYGSSPLEGTRATALNLQPVMRVTAPLMAVHELPVGAAVGYGSRWVAQRPSRIGIVAIGYGDGYPRTVQGAVALLAGQPVPVVGRVSMDMLMVDLTDLSFVPPLDAEVELWGDAVSVDVVAACCGTIGYELLCRMTDRPERRWV